MTELNNLFDNENTQTGNEFSKEEWIKQKIESREEACVMLEIATEELDTPDSVMAYLDIQSRFDRYSVSNSLLIAYQNPDATRICDSKTWQKNNVRINKGEPKESKKSEAQEVSDMQDSTETIAAPIPHPIIDLSPAKLADQNYLLGQFYIVDSNTEADAVQINAEDFLKQDFKISKDTSAPQILIYHSHSQETFADSREGEEADTIVGVGDYLTQILTESYGYQVVHLKEQFDMAGGELDRSAAYDYARDYLEPYLQKNPDIQVIIDLHRDGVPEDRHLVTEINGKPTAQILFYNGLSYITAKGSLDYLPNPYIQQNLAFSFQLEYQAAQYYPEFYRGIYLAGYRYNLHFRPCSILLEAGAQTNTVQEVKNAMEPFADILNKVLQG